MRMRQNVIGGLPGCTIFFPHYFINCTIFEKKKFLGINVFFDFLQNVCRKHFSFYRGADKSLAWPDWKKQLKGRHFSSDAEVIAAAKTWRDGQLSELFLSG